MDFDNFSRRYSLRIFFFTDFRYIYKISLRNFGKSLSKSAFWVPKRSKFQIALSQRLFGVQRPPKYHHKPETGFFTDCKHCFGVFYVFRDDITTFCLFFGVKLADYFYKCFWNQRRKKIGGCISEKKYRNSFWFFFSVRSRIALEYYSFLVQSRDSQKS